ncbi:hypothetical protein VPH35_063671 [Triticum aestivum]
METRGRRKRAAAPRDRLSSSGPVRRCRRAPCLGGCATSGAPSHASTSTATTSPSRSLSIRSRSPQSKMMTGTQRPIEEDALAKLADFADNLMFHHCLSGEALDTLRLRIHRQDDGRRHGSNDKDMISRWIRRGLRLSPAAIDITIDGVPMRQPSYFSNAGACFRRLAKLRIDNVLLSRNIEHLFGTDSLPALRDLEIRNSGLGYIVSDTLRNLTVVYDSPVIAHRCDVFGHIAAPGLVSLRLEFPLARLANLDITIGELPCLAKASIRLLDETPQPLYWDSHDKDKPDTTRLVITNLCDLLGSLCNVTSLHLSGFQEMARTHAVLLQAVLDEPCCVFPDLKSLVLDDCNLGDGLQTLWRFLHKTPALERLALKSCKWQDVPYARESDEEQDLETATMAMNLKLVQILHGNNKLRSKIKRKLPQATITK